ncbi:response regulator [Rhodobacteraceae bacterium RKSG542]|uniref:ATP-binding protein n=1 Tax=Pseudovibrio flavus TaxID=2529854 RepID=UPI0012BD4B10|nr:ATP-binding protein [Pseudovibrio flavus]MTI17518.1 response regulator [Pseudovibrio flavus]
MSSKKEDGLQFEPTLEQLGIVNSQPEQCFDTITSLTSQVLGVPVSLVSIVQPEEDRQYFKSALGLGEPWASRRQTPLSHSFCKLVCATDELLNVSNAPEDDRVKNNLAVSELGVVAYLGAPIRIGQSSPIGALCAIDGNIREWSKADEDTLKTLARAVTDQFTLRRLLATSNDELDQAKSSRLTHDQFIATLCHEIRNPLQAITGSMEMLRKTPLDPEQTRYVDVTISSAQTLQGHADDILEIKRADEGIIKLQKHPFSFQSLLSEVQFSCGHNMKENNNIFHITTKLNALDYNGDRRRIFQIISNLVNNASKFTKDGNVELSITSESLREGEDTLVISVSDNGCGISPEQCERIFEKYYVGDASNTAAQPSTGIGLSVCKSLIEAMNGQIGVSSELGKGTSFEVRIPMERAAPEPANRITVPEPEIESGPNLLALVADDNDLNRQLTSAILKTAGYTVDTAATGLEALGKAEQSEYAIILTDIGMPDLDGIEFTKQLRSSTSPSANSPIWAVTGNVMEEKANEYLAAGMQGYLPKPINLDKLNTLLKSLGTNQSQLKKHG